MPVVLILFGIILTVAGARNKQGDLFELVKGDFTGANNFVYWALALLLLGAIGYVPKLRGLSQMFILLVLVVIFLSHKGFFPQFQSAISSTTTAGTQPAKAA